MINFSSVDYQQPTGLMALSDINLTIRSGEIIAIVGENGAGKTTLVKHMNGLLKPYKGIVTIFGVDTKKESVAALSKKVGIIFQNPDHQLFSDTVEHEIMFALKNFGFKKEIIEERIEWALNYFSLQKYRTTSPMLLSGGEKKRLCIASVLAWDPDIVVMDEPTVGQDYTQKSRLINIINLIVSQGKSVVMVSHDIEFLWPLQPRVVVMVGGKIVADDKASNIFKNKKILEKARIVQPQLVELSEKLLSESLITFSNVSEARIWVLNQLSSD